MVDEGQDDEGHARRRALLNTMAPWLDSVFHTPPTIELTSGGSHVAIDLLVVVDAALQPDPNLAPMDHDVAHGLLQEIREGIDLVYMFLLLDPIMLWTSRGRKLSTSEACALQRLKSFRLSVTLSQDVPSPSALLQRRLCEYFVETLDRQVSSNQRYLELRSTLGLELDAADPRWQERLDQNPVALQFETTTSFPVESLPYTTEDALQDLVDFIVYADALQPASTVAGPTIETLRHIPVVVESVIFELEHFLLTSRTVQIVRRLAGCRDGFVACESVKIDPRMFQCSHEELTAFLNAVSVDLDEGIDVFTAGLFPSRMDSDGRSRANVCEEVLRGVANCENVNFVGLEGMLELCATEASRRGIFRGLVNHVFTRPTTCSVSFGPVTPRDAELLRGEYIRWDIYNGPLEPMRVEMLDVKDVGIGNDFLSALIFALDEVEVLHLGECTRPLVVSFEFFTSTKRTSCGSQKSKLMPSLLHFK